MKILLVTQWFDPEPTFKGMAFARGLQRLGHEVEVITGVPNYPGGRIYPGYRMRWLSREEHDGIRVNRVPLYPSHDGSRVGRVLNYASFATAAFLYGVFGARRADVVYSYHPPLTTALAGVGIGFMRRIPHVNDIQDLWPDSLQATGMVGSGRVLGVVSAVCRWVYRRASLLVVQSPGFQRELVARGVPPGKIEVIYNWCDESALADAPPSPAAAAAMDGRFNVVFAGTMGKAQALDAVLGAAAILAPELPAVQFVFVGGGVEVERLKASSAGRPNVVFLPRMPMAEIGSVLRAADALLVHLRDDRLFSITVPSKTQAYMAMGRPLLMGVRGDAAALVEASGGGVLAEPEDPASIADAVRRLATLPAAERDAMGRRAAAHYAAHLSLHAGTSRFGEVFRRVIDARDSAREPNPQ